MRRARAVRDRRHWTRRLRLPSRAVVCTPVLAQASASADVRHDKAVVSIYQGTRYLWCSNHSLLLRATSQQTAANANKIWISSQALPKGRCTKLVFVSHTFRTWNFAYQFRPPRATLPRGPRKGPRATCMPLPLYSRPKALPYLSIRSRSKVAPRWMPAGNADTNSCPRTPAGASAKHSSGI